MLNSMQGNKYKKRNPLQPVWTILTFAIWREIHVLFNDSLWNHLAHIHRRKVTAIVGPHRNRINFCRHCAPRVPSLPKWKPKPVLGCSNCTYCAHLCMRVNLLQTAHTQTWNNHSSSQTLKRKQSSVAYSNHIPLNWEAETNQLGDSRLLVPVWLYHLVPKTRLTKVSIGCFKVFLLEFHMALHVIGWEVLNISEQGFTE